MSFTATTYRVLIASPSDLTEEREAATIAIHDWNAQHAAAEGIVLLPVKWETHARPESGVRPQEAINAQIVQTCDILLGMFWTKLGSDTGVAESGTVRGNQSVCGAAETGPPLFFRPAQSPERDQPRTARETKRLQGHDLQSGACRIVSQCG
jgi:hypothetical protein